MAANALVLDWNVICFEELFLSEDNTFATDLFILPYLYIISCRETSHPNGKIHQQMSFL